MAVNDYKRIMIKMSGEMLGGSSGVGINGEAIEKVAGEVASVAKTGLEVGVVIGGGNIWRGASSMKWDMERTDADYMGMLATVINALALQSVLENKFNVYTRVMSAIHMAELCEPYIKRKAIKHLEKKRVVIFAGGTGNPYFTTDTAASLRAREINAEIILKATKVDGIYDSDPTKNDSAKKFKEISYLDTIAKNLQVMDATAVTMCMEAKIPILVFKLDGTDCITNALNNTECGTIVR